MRMKKLSAFTLAGVMAFSMPVMAASSPTAEAVVASAVTAAVADSAAAENKTVGEYMNNAVTQVPGLESVLPLGQGGHVIINGAPSNQTFSVLKPERKEVDAAKKHADTLNGKVLNVAKINASIRNFNSAMVNFYMKGLKAGQNVKVYQLVDGVWIELTVTEIREDHIVVDMKSLGTLAFVEVPMVTPLPAAQTTAAPAVTAPAATTEQTVSAPAATTEQTVSAPAETTEQTTSAPAETAEQTTSATTETKGKTVLNPVGTTKPAASSTASDSSTDAER